MDHASDHPASAIRLCLRCGSPYHAEHKSECAAGLCNNTCSHPGLTVRGWDEARARAKEGRSPGTTANEALNIIGQVLRQSSSPLIAFVRQEEDGFSFFTYKNGGAQRWLLCAEGVTIYE